MNQQLSARKRMAAKVAMGKVNCKTNILLEVMELMSTDTDRVLPAKKPRTQRRPDKVSEDVEAFLKMEILNPNYKSAHYAKDNNIDKSNFAKQVKKVKEMREAAAAAEVSLPPVAATATPAAHGPKFTNDVVEVKQIALQQFCKVTNNLMHQLWAGSKLTIPKPEPVNVDMDGAVATSEYFYWDVHPGVCVTQLEGFENIFRWQNRDTQFSIVRLHSRHTDRAMQQQVEYGKAVPGFRMEEQRCLKARPLILVCGYWPTENGWNYGFTEKTNIRESSIVKFARDTSQWCLDTRTYRRSGAAGGIIEFFDTPRDYLNPSMLSVGTTIDREYKITDGPAPNATPIYSSEKDGHRVQLRPRNDIHGYRLTTTTIRKTLERSEAHREYAIKIQQSRFKCQLLVCYFDLPQEDRMPPTLANWNESGIWEHFNAVRKKFKPATVKKWKKFDKKLTEWEIFLLEYWLMTGELVNDEPVAAHCDKSKGHIIETLFLTAKIDPNDTDSNANIARRCASETGQVMIPFQDSAFLLEPGTEVMHANFQHTTHLAESSRGRTNVSNTKHS